MTKLSKKEPFVFVLGDFAALVFSLWLTLVLRYLDLPSKELFLGHLEPFFFIFLAWLLVFFIAGLYERQTIIIEKRLPGILFRAYLANAFISVAFFYLLPSYEIAPKTNLFIELLVSFFLVLAWRLIAGATISARSRDKALLIASGPELTELRKEVNSNSRYPFRFDSVIDLGEKGQNIQENITREMRESGVSIVVADLSDQRLAAALPQFYSVLFSGVTFVEFETLYEDVFGRVPLSLVSYEWFLKNISLSRKPLYDAVKRGMDIALSIPVGVICLASYPFVWIALKIQDGGEAAIAQERIGRGGRIMHIYKYRSMQGSDRGVWVSKNDNRVTLVGKILRKTRIDELLQVWNVLRGDISFIGPRPDIIGTYEQLVKELPYYDIRYVIKPGLSGWAQIKQEKPPQSLEETRLRLAYDFYYIKNRSLMLDLQIALRTIQTLLSRLGV